MVRRVSVYAVSRYTGVFKGLGLYAKYSHDIYTGPFDVPLDRTETFSPTVHYETLQMVVAAAVHRGWTVSQFDVETAFLYGEIDVEVFIIPPEMAEIGEGKAWWLKKGLYGLKQLEHIWYLTLRKEL
jgi:hypothetical protein